MERTFTCGSYLCVERHSLFWKVVGSCAHTRESRTATVHGAPYTVNSRVVVGPIYVYMCTYSYRTRCTIHGVPYTVNSRVEGAFTCGSYSCVERHSRVEGTFMCGSYSRVEEAFTCGSYSRVEGTFTCGSYSRVERATKVKFFTP